MVLLCYHPRRCLEFLILKASFKQGYFIIARATYCTQTQLKPLHSKLTSNAKTFGRNNGTLLPCLPSPSWFCEPRFTAATPLSPFP